MPEITCNAERCAFNKEGYCERQEIRVDCEQDSSGEKTLCDSFEEHCDGCRFCGENSILDNTGVECFASSCIYNQNRECIADYINIEGRNASCGEDTFCDTYRTPRVL